MASANDFNPKALVQKINLSDDSYKFQTPCAICISGPQQSGKSSFIVQLVKHRNLLFTQDFDKCYYCQPANLCVRPNPIYEQIRQSLPNSELICGLPDITKLSLDLDSSCKLVVIDDLMNSLLNSADIVNLLSVHVHHSNITVIFTLHNYYAGSRHGKTISRNLNYTVFFYNRLDLRELKIISGQIGNNPNFLQECFSFLMKKLPKENAYVLIDGHFQSEMKAFYIRSHIFPINGQIKPIIFFPA